MVKGIFSFMLMVRGCLLPCSVTLCSSRTFSRLAYLYKVMHDSSHVPCTHDILLHAGNSCTRVHCMCANFHGNDVPLKYALIHMA